LTALAIAIDAALRAANNQLWVQIWRSSIRECIADWLVEQVEPSAAAIRGDWAEADSEAGRKKVASSRSDLLQICEQYLKVELPAVNAALQGRFSPITATKLLALGPPLIARLATESCSDAVFAENPFPDIWKATAHGLAKKAYKLRKGQGPAVDSKLYNPTLVMAFLFSCRVPEARFVQNKLNELGRRLSSWPGTMVRLAEYLSEDGICDVPPRETPRIGGLHLVNAKSSSLLQHLVDESTRVVAQKGFLARFFASQPGVPSGLPTGVTDQMFLDARQKANEQFEYLLLTYGALSGIEQLLRSWAQSSGFTGEAGEHSVKMPELASKLRASPDLQRAVTELYDPKGANIRGRILHGGLLDTVTKSVEAYLPTIDPVRYASLTNKRDGYSAENLCHLCFEALELVDAEVRLSATAHDWTSHFTLSPADFVQAQNFDCLLNDPNKVKRSEQLRNFLGAMAPLYSVPVKLGLFAQLGVHLVTDFELARFLSQVFVFELAYRSTARLVGIDVLQVSEPASKVKFQYWMLDRTKLLSDKTTGKMFGYIGEPELSTVRTVMRLAARIRDAVAHGAMINIVDRNAIICEQTIFTALEYLTSAAVHHMTETAAYYVWQNESHGEHGHDLADWFKAKGEVCAILNHETNRM
jgi:hypothetical protein